MTTISLVIDWSRSEYQPFFRSAAISWYIASISREKVRKTVIWHRVGKSSFYARKWSELLVASRELRSLALITSEFTYILNYIQTVFSHGYLIRLVENVHFKKKPCGCRGAVYHTGRLRKKAQTQNYALHSIDLLSSGIRSHIWVLVLPFVISVASGLDWKFITSTPGWGCESEPASVVAVRPRIDGTRLCYIYVCLIWVL